jgi:hypothetical protein
MSAFIIALAFFLIHALDSFIGGWIGGYVADNYDF